MNAEFPKECPITLDEIAILKAAVAEAGRDVVSEAERNVFRTQTDFIGRMNDCFMRLDGLYDEQTETYAPGDDRDEAIGNLIGLAGLCVGLVAMLKTPEPANQPS